MLYESRFSLNGHYRVAGIAEIASDLHKNAQWVNSVNERGETPLHIAARYKKFDVFKAMLPHFKKLKSCDNQGNTILHSLLDNSTPCLSKHEKKCSELINILILDDEDVNKKNRNGWTLVHLAARNCQIEVLRVLEKYNLDFSLRVENGETVLHLACKNMTNLVDTPTEMDIINNLIFQGCDINAKNDKGYSVLHYAVDWCGARVVDKLIDCGANLNCQTKLLRLTPLHLATRQRNLIVMETLMKAGANVNVLAYAGLTPLHLAVIMGSWDMSKLLIDYDADVDSGEQWTPLHLAIYLKRRDLFKLLIREQVNVNIAGVDRLTPLHLATMLGNFKFAKVLIDRRANVNCKDINNYTPLHAAIKESRYPSVCRALQSSIHVYTKDSTFTKIFAPFFNVNMNHEHKMISRILLGNAADVNALTIDNESPLYFAAENGNIKLVGILLRLGAIVDVQEKHSGLTPLHAATRWNHVDVVRELLNAGADPDIKSYNGWSPLHLATVENRVEVVKELIIGNAYINSTTDDGMTALHLATLNNHVDVIKELLHGNASVNIRAKNGKSPLHLAVEENNNKAFKLMFKHGSCMTDEDRRLRNSPLHVAARENNELMIQFLVKFGAKLNAVNEDGFTPLHCALDHGQYDAAAMLIGFDADVNCKTKKHQLTPLHLALQRRQYNLVETLIRAGANVNVGDATGVTPIHLAVLDRYGSNIDSLIRGGVFVNCMDKILKFTPLHIAVHERNQRNFDLIISLGADVNASDKNGITPLHLAAMLGEFYFVEHLIKNGADVNCRDVNKYTPLHFVLCNSRAMKKIYGKIYFKESSLISKSLTKPQESVNTDEKEIIELLINYDADLNAVSISGESLFYFAVEANAVEFIKILMDIKFPVNLNEKQLGLTPLQTAVLNDHKEVVQLLISYGADVNVLTENGRNLLHLAAESGGTKVLEFLLRHESNSNNALCGKCPFMCTFDKIFKSQIGLDVNSKDNFGMTPLHLTALQSNRKQATETLLIHGACTDVPDNKGYLPIHYALENNRYQQLDCLLAFGVDINDSKIFEKIDGKKIGYDSLVGLRMLQHLIKLKAVGFPIADFYELVLKERRYLEDIFYEECLKEIERLKAYMVGKDASLYNLLHIKLRGRCIFVSSLEPREIGKEFPIYYSLILDIYHETIVKRSLIKKAEMALFQLTEIDMPVVCTENIFCYLSIISLVTLIKAAEISCQSPESNKKYLCIQAKNSDENQFLNTFCLLLYKIFNACVYAKDILWAFMYAVFLFLPNLMKIVYTAFNKWF